MLHSNNDDWVTGANKEWSRLKTFTLERYEKPKITIKIEESLSVGSPELTQRE